MQNRICQEIKKMALRVIVIVTLLAEAAEAQWTTGPHGGIQACPKEVKISDALIEARDEVEEAQQRVTEVKLKLVSARVKEKEAETKESLKELSGERMKVEDDLELALTDFRRKKESLYQAQREFLREQREETQRRIRAQSEGSFCADCSMVGGVRGCGMGVNRDLSLQSQMQMQIYQIQMQTQMLMQNQQTYQMKIQTASVLQTEIQTLIYRLQQVQRSLEFGRYVGFEGSIGMGYSPAVIRPSRGIVSAPSGGR